MNGASIKDDEIIAAFSQAKGIDPVPPWGNSMYLRNEQIIWVVRRFLTGLTRFPSAVARNEIIEECAAELIARGESVAALYIRALKNAAPQGQVVEGAASPAQPAVAAPVASSPIGRSEDAQDAARYRWLRTYWRRVVSHCELERIVWMSLHSDNTIATNEDSVDAAIDKAMEEARYVRR